VWPVYLVLRCQKGGCNIFRSYDFRCFLVVCCCFFFFSPEEEKDIWSVSHQFIIKRLNQEKEWKNCQWCTASESIYWLTIHMFCSLSLIRQKNDVEQFSVAINSPGWEWNWSILFDLGYVLPRRCNQHPSLDLWRWLLQSTTPSWYSHWL
jgi:hypothetical protein